MSDILMEYVCNELEDVEKDGLSAKNLDSTDKLLNIKKNLMKIEMLENESGYSMGDGEWYAQGSYADGMGGGSYRGSYAGGSYRGSRGGGYSREGMSVSSYAQRRDSRGRYSRAEAKMSMLDKMEGLMDEAQTEKERKVIREAMEKIEKA